MTNEEAIQKQVELLRKGYYIRKYPDEIERVCNECDVQNFLFAGRNELGYETINLKCLGIPEPFHRASLIGFNAKEGPEWFIVDPTYGQFFENEMFKNYMFKNYKEFSLELLDKGYIKCSLLNMLCYINGFVLSGAYTTSVDKDKVYENVEELLLSQNIVNREINSTYDKLMELLCLRKELLETNDNNKVTEDITISKK